MRMSLLLLLCLTCFIPAASEDSALALLLAETRQDTLQGRWDTATAKLRAAVSRTPDLRQQAALCAELGRVLAERSFFYKVDPEPALRAAERALELSERAGANKTSAKALFTLGRIHYGEKLVGRGDWESPRSYVERALRIQQQVNDREGIAHSLFYLGLIEQMQSHLEPAMDYFQRSLAIAESDGDLVMQSYDLRHIGYVHQASGKSEMAKREYERSLALREQAGFTVGVPFAMNLLADFLAEQGQKEEAASMFEEAIALAARDNSPRARFLGELSLGKLCLEQGKVEQARRLTERARAGAEEFGHTAAAREAEKQLREITEARKERRAAVTSESPVVRNGHAMIYDESLGRVIMFGGADASSVRSETLAWDDANRRWQRLEGAGPSPRTFPAFAYDAERQEGVLFGGNRVLFGRADDQDTFLGDTWVLKEGQWSRRSVPGPHARAEAGIAYDRIRQRIVLFGGYYREKGGRTVRLGDTWEWDGQEWSLMATTGPRPRSGMAMAYNERRRRSVLFGGSGLAGDTWEWDGIEWKEAAAGDVPGRFNPVMAFDPVIGQLVRFGGWNGKTRVAETWILQPAGWTRLEIPRPSARNHAAFVYDRGRSRGVLFGGHDGDHIFGDVWEWNGSRWSRVLDVPAQRRVENSH